LMKIEALRLKNYKVFQELTLKDLPNMAVFLGANGSGKSTLFDVFGFLHDALINNIRSALMRRGGFKEVISRDQKGPIEIEIKFRPEPGEPLVTYELHIDLDRDGAPGVAREILKYRRGGGGHGKPWHFLDFTFGKGTAIVNEEDYGKKGVTEKWEDQLLDSPDTLALKALGQLQKYKQVTTFRRLIEGWHVSDFHIQAARSSQEPGYAEHLSSTGENLPW
jgi:predicted ATPase